MRKKDEQETATPLPNENSASVFYDAHCHALSGWEEVRASSLAPLRGGFLCTASPSDFQAARFLGKTPPTNFDLLIGFGIHPWYLPRETNSLKKIERDLAERLEEYPQAAVGEIGLHFTAENRSGTERDEQRRLFQLQLKLAQAYRRGIAIHSVHAAAEILQFLGKNPFELPLLLHSLSADEGTVRRFVRLGGWFSFSAEGLTPNRKRSRETARAVPLDRLLVESDASAAAECAKRLPIAIERLAELRGKPFDEFAVQLADNWRRFFALFSSPRGKGSFGNFAQAKTEEIS